MARLPDGGTYKTIDPEWWSFLEWLSPVLGIWRHEQERFQVRRRDDGWLTVLPLSGHQRSLAWVLHHASRDDHQDIGPLGPAPILFSRSLLSLWLTPEEIRSLNLPYAFVVSSGRERVYELLMKHVREATPDELRTKNHALWASAALEPISDDDRHLIATVLLPRYRAESGRPVTSRLEDVLPTAPTAGGRSGVGRDHPTRARSGAERPQSPQKEDTRSFPHKLEDGFFNLWGLATVLSIVLSLGYAMLVWLGVLRRSHTAPCYGHRCAAPAVSPEQVIGTEVSLTAGARRGTANLCAGPVHRNVELAGTSEVDPPSPGLRRHGHQLARSVPYLSGRAAAG